MIKTWKCDTSTSQQRKKKRIEITREWLIETSHAYSLKNCNYRGFTSVHEYGVTSAKQDNGRHWTQEPKVLTKANGSIIPFRIKTHQHKHLPNDYKDPSNKFFTNASFYAHPPHCCKLVVAKPFCCSWICLHALHSFDCIFQRQIKMVLATLTSISCFVQSYQWHAWISIILSCKSRLPNYNRYFLQSVTVISRCHVLPRHPSLM